MDWYEEQKKAEACIDTLAMLAKETTTDGTNVILGITRDKLTAIRETANEAIKHLDESKKMYDEGRAAEQEKQNAKEEKLKALDPFSEVAL